MKREKQPCVSCGAMVYEVDYEYKKHNKNCELKERWSMKKPTTADLQVISECLLTVDICVISLEEINDIISKNKKYKDFSLEPATSDCMECGGYSVLHLMGYRFETVAEFEARLKREEQDKKKQKVYKKTSAAKKKEQELKILNRLAKKYNFYRVEGE